MVTATEVGRNLSAILDMAAMGEVIEIKRGGEHVATIMPPHRPNGAKVRAAYANNVPDPAFADVLDEAHALLNTPTEVVDPWRAA